MSARLAVSQPGGLPNVGRLITPHDDHRHGLGKDEGSTILDASQVEDEDDSAVSCDDAGTRSKDWSKIDVDYSIPAGVLIFGL